MFFKMVENKLSPELNKYILLPYLAHRIFHTKSCQSSLLEHSNINLGAGYHIQTHTTHILDKPHLPLICYSMPQVIIKHIWHRRKKASKQCSSGKTVILAPKYSLNDGLEKRGIWKEETNIRNRVRISSKSNITQDFFLFPISKTFFL